MQSRRPRAKQDTTLKHACSSDTPPRPCSSLVQGCFLSLSRFPSPRAQEPPPRPPETVEMDVELARAVAALPLRRLWKPPRRTDRPLPCCTFRGGDIVDVSLAVGGSTGTSCSWPLVLPVLTGETRQWRRSDRSACPSWRGRRARAPLGPAGVAVRAQSSWTEHEGRRRPHLLQTVRCGTWRPAGRRARGRRARKGKGWAGGSRRMSDHRHSGRCDMKTCGHGQWGGGVCPWERQGRGEWVRSGGSGDDHDSGAREQTRAARRNGSSTLPEVQTDHKATWPGFVM